ncbi:MAG: FAD-dependent oxidoreductase [Rhodobacteraceae bacterium]|nr:FAD-dependent oxidoreductase [Paracoccaceae bacterium]
MPGPTLVDFHSDPSLPHAVDTVVIGGGIIGVSTALELAERGTSVLLCEKGQIGGEQSSRNWGWVRISRRDPREIPLMAEALRIWPELDKRVGHGTGYRRAGIFFAAETERKAQWLQDWAEHLRPFQLDGHMVRGTDLEAVMPGHQMSLQGGLFTPVDGRAEPQMATPALAEGARSHGAHVMTGCAVRSLDMQGGKLAGVITERGRVACSSVVLAGGAWSRLFAGNAGIQLPQLKVLNSVLRTSRVDGPEAAIWAGGFALRKRADGGYTVASGTENIVDLVPDSLRLGWQFLPALREEWKSLRFRLSGRWREEARQSRRWTADQVTPFEQCRILDPDPASDRLEKGWQAARSAFPALRQAKVEQSWAGLIDVTPDAVPVISGVDDVPGLYIATGFSGHGFGIGPAAGRLMADMVLEQSPIVDPHDFRLSRFSDGTKVAPFPSI